jgi:hypothetical protein
MDVEDISIL